MSKKKILIASVLKPVNDSRNYEKIGISINQTGNYEVHIAGQPAAIAKSSENIFFHPIFSFKRISFGRLIASFNFFVLLFKTKPDLVIITTFELIKPAIFYKLFTKTKLIYDVQENYYRNLVYTNSFPPVLKNLIAIYVRALEWCSRPFINHYILAEKNYEKEFSFSKNKSLIIENKCRKPILTFNLNKNQGIKLLYTGTIAENYGIFEAVEMAIKLHQEDNSISMDIVGYCSKKSVLEKLKEKIKHSSYIQLLGGEKLVAHEEILKAISKANIGFISYNPNKSTENCIPTKLYEYLAYKLPYIVCKNKTWEEITLQHQAGIVTDYHNFDAKEIIKKIKNLSFYDTSVQEDIYWETEEIKLIQLIKHI